MFQFSVSYIPEFSSAFCTAAFFMNAAAVADFLFLTLVLLLLPLAPQRKEREEEKSPLQLFADTESPYWEQPPLALCIIARGH